MIEFNRKIELNAPIKVKLTELGIKQWSYFLRQNLGQVKEYLETKNNYIELEMGVFISAFGGVEITTFIDGEIYLKETKFERRKRIINDIID